MDTEAASRHAGARRHGRAAGARRRARLPARHGLRGGPRERDAPAGERHPERPRGARRRLGRRPSAAGGWSACGAQTQVFHQAFSAVSADRSREDLTRTQRVPASALGLSAQWGRLLGSRHRVLAGAEARLVQGTTEETVYARGSPTTAIEAGGTERSGAVFLQDLVQAHPRLLLTGALRLDSWAHRDGSVVTTPLATSVSSTTAFADRQETALSPRLGLVFRASPTLSLLASGYGAFRGPTLNELYRSFRVGDTLTLANPDLEAERLRGGEAGALVTRGRVSLRLTAFDAEVDGAVANVTVAIRPRPRHPPATQRRTRPLARARGGGGVAGRRPWRPHRRLRPHRRPRAELPGGPRARGPAAAPGPAPPGDVPGALRRPGEAAAQRVALGLGCRRGGRARPGRTTATSSSSTRRSRSTSSPPEDRRRPRGLRRGGERPRRRDRGGPHPGAEPGRAAPPPRGSAAAGLLSSAAPGRPRGRLARSGSGRPARVPVQGQLVGRGPSHPHVGPEGRHPQLARGHPPAHRREAGGAVEGAQGLGAAGRDGHDGVPALGRARRAVPAARPARAAGRRPGRGPGARGPRRGRPATPASGPASGTASVTTGTPRSR